MDDLAPRPTLATRLALLVAVVAGSALLLRLGLTIFAPDPVPDDPGLGTRLVRFFSYFTIQSNIAVFLISLATVQGRDLAVPSTRALRLAALVGITVTGIVYITILADDPQQRSALSSVANVLLHYLIPPLALGAWLLAGPWQGLRLSDLGRMVAWPVLWFSWTMLHGALTDWYPYGFVDVAKHGYPQVFLTFTLIAGFALLLGALLVAWEGWRRGGAPGSGEATPAAAD